MPFDKQALTRKLGPIPVWGWGIVGVGAIGSYLYFRKRKTSASAASTAYTAPFQQAVPTGGIGGDTGTSSGGSATDQGTGVTTDTATGTALNNLTQGLGQWFGTLLAAIQKIPTAPPTTLNTTTTPPPTAGALPPVGTPPTTGTPGSPQSPGTNIGGGSNDSNLIPIMNIAQGIGIPQIVLHPGMLNVVRVPEAINTSDLQGWTAWAYTPRNADGYTNLPFWTQFTGGIIPAGTYGVDPTGLNPNTRPGNQLGPSPNQPQHAPDFAQISGVSQPF